MTISNIDLQLLLIQQVGDVDPYTADPILPITAGSSGIVLTNAGRIWDMYSPFLGLNPFLGPQIFGYYFKQAAVQLIIGVLESRVDFSAVNQAINIRLNQRIQARMMQLTAFAKEIVRLEARLIANGVPVVGLIRRIEPIMPPQPGDTSSPLAEVGGNTLVLDANDARIQGSPYWVSSFPPGFRH